jgi:hypothetical protein
MSQERRTFLIKALGDLCAQGVHCCSCGKIIQVTNGGTCTSDEKDKNEHQTNPFKHGQLKYRKKQKVNFIIDLREISRLEVSVTES